MDLEREIIQLLKKFDIEFALTLPCAKIKRLLVLTAKTLKHIPLSREEEGIGIASGIHLAGKRSVLMMQSGGIGNSLNALLSLAQVYHIPIPIIISWRGIYKEGIEAQIPMGKYLPKILKAAKIPYIEIHEAADSGKIEKALADCFANNTPTVMLISPAFWEQSVPSEEEVETVPFPVRNVHFSIDLAESIISRPTLTRYQILELLSGELRDKIIISNIGIPSKELFAILDQPTNFYMLGSFGMVSAIGLGVALCTDREVFVIDGDASILTNPNTLGTIAQERQECKNLTILLMDNGTCGSTGNQLTAAYKHIDLEFLARVYGIEHTKKVGLPEEILEGMRTLPFGPRLFHIIIKPENAKVKNIPFSAVEIKKRFQKTLQE